MGIHFPRARRKRLRLKGYDYSTAGLYFVTVCANGMDCLFGYIRDGRMQPNTLGRIVLDEWEHLEGRSPWIGLDAFVLMPNHVHGIVAIGGEEVDLEARRVAAPPLSGIVGAFKSESARRVNLVRGTPGRTLWQRGFYEHIVRDERALERIRAYIDGNPAAWDEDRYHPRWSRSDGVDRSRTSEAGGVNPAPTTETPTTTAEAAAETGEKAGRSGEPNP